MRIHASDMREEGTHYIYLLSTMVGFMIAGPIVSRWQMGHVVMQVAITALLIISVLATAGHRSRFAFIVSVAAVTLISHWADHLLKEPSWLEYPPLISGLIFFLLVILALVRHIFMERDHITVGFLCGVANVYMLIAVFFAYAFALVDVTYPGSLSGENFTRIGNEIRLAPFIYFSFATLTTVGYGDIVPSGRLAGMLAALEATTGQLYMAILVGRLVGMKVQRMNP